MYYRYDDRCEIIEKSNIELKGENVATCVNDFDLDLYRVIIGYIDENGVILKYSHIPKEPKVLANEIEKLKQYIYELELKIDKLVESKSES